MTKPRLLQFVHALGGDAKETWGRFGELIAADPELSPAFDVANYTFPTSVFYVPWLVEDKGYVITTATRMSERQSCLSKTATVLYYSDSAAAKARKLADALTRATSTPFGTAKGQGLGVIQGQERWTFYVHSVHRRG